MWRQGISCQHFFLFVGSFKEAGERKKINFWLTEAMPRLTWTLLESGSSQKLQLSALKTGVT